MVEKKQAEHGRVHWEEIGWISASGGIGGALAWVWEIWLEIAIWSFDKLAELPMYMAFGAGAAAVFILLIADSDRSDKLRIVALALVSGFAWKPIWISSHGILDTPHAKSLIDGPRYELTSTSDGSGPLDETEDDRSVDGLTQAYTQLIARFFAEPQRGEPENEAGVWLGKREKIDVESFRFSVDEEGPLVVEIEAEDPDTDLVATLYRYSGGESEVIGIDDDSGSRFNPRIDLDKAEAGDYLVVLRRFETSRRYAGLTSVFVSRS